MKDGADCLRIFANKVTAYTSPAAATCYELTLHQFSLRLAKRSLIASPE